MTIKDIAKKCHVGVSTVSRAMNNHPDINPETKEKILKAIEEANYVPNNSARNLKRNDAKAIAVLVKGIGNTFFSELVGILERECEKKGDCVGWCFWEEVFLRVRKRSVRWRFPAYSVPSVRWGCRVHPWLPYRWMILRKAIR